MHSMTTGFLENVILEPKTQNSHSNLPLSDPTLLTESSLMTYTSFML